MKDKHNLLRHITFPSRMRIRETYGEIENYSSNIQRYFKENALSSIS